LKPGKMAPKPVFIGEIHTKFAKNDFWSYKIHKKKLKKYIKTKKNQCWKKWRKKLAKHTFSRFQCIIQITIFLHYLGCTLSDCIIILSGKILEL
jgi:hypothetical protein